jgi:hypothetical protein
MDVDKRLMLLSSGPWHANQLYSLPEELEVVTMAAIPGAILLLTGPGHLLKLAGETISKLNADNE